MHAKPTHTSVVPAVAPLCSLSPLHAPALPKGSRGAYDQNQLQLKHFQFGRIHFFIVCFVRFMHLVQFTLCFSIPPANIEQVSEPVREKG